MHGKTFGGCSGLCIICHFEVGPVPERWLSKHIVNLCLASSAVKLTADKWAANRSCKHAIICLSPRADGNIAFEEIPVSGVRNYKCAKIATATDSKWWSIPRINHTSASCDAVSGVFHCCKVHGMKQRRNNNITNFNQILNCHTNINFHGNE